jgi:protein-S-isoprenylcysteine O-methyltransferase Ste14
MIEKELYQNLLILIFVLAPCVAFALFYITAPYGRHLSLKNNFSINVKSGWVIMEVAALLSFDISFLLTIRSSIAWVFFLLWNAHYIYRTFLFPLRMPVSSKVMPITIILSGFIFNCINGYLNGRYFSAFGPMYTIDWLISPQFIIGVLLFVLGFFINIHSDNILLQLRKPGETDYKIPSGFLYEYISCPNYFGEVIEWFGWAIATWSLPGLAFAIFTAANLIPRAYSNHRWYREKFSHYPTKRKAVIPFIF